MTATWGSVRHAVEAVIAAAVWPPAADAMLFASITAEPPDVPGRDPDVTAAGDTRAATKEAHS